MSHKLAIGLTRRRCKNWRSWVSFEIASRP